MKKILSLLILMTGVIFFSSCENDRDSNPYLQSPSSFVLNTPKYTTGVYDLKNTQSIQLTCTQPDYGYTAATTYSVQIATKADFAEFATLPTTFTSAKIEANASEMAVALVGLLGVESEEDYPEDLFPVYVRLSAKITETLGITLSNIIELPNVKGYFALDPMTMPENMYMIGNVAGNWDWSKSISMVPVYGTPGKFFAVQYLGKAENGENAKIKFNTVKDWSEGEPVGFEKGNPDAASITLANLKADGDGNIEVGSPGWYIVVITTEIEGRSYKYKVQILEPNVYLQGHANGGAGEWGAIEKNLFTVPDVSKGPDQQFVSPAFVAVPPAADGVRASIVLDGHDWWHTEFIIIDGKLEYRGAGGDQNRVSGAVGQKLYINFTARTGEIK